MFCVCMHPIGDSAFHAPCAQASDGLVCVNMHSMHRHPIDVSLVDAVCCAYKQGRTRGGIGALKALDQYLTSRMLTDAAELPDASMRGP